MTKGCFEIENQIELVESLEAVVLAERVVSYLLGGTQAAATSTSVREELLTANEDRTDNWFLSRGQTTYAVEISKLFPCQTVIGRNRALFEVARVAKEGAVYGALPFGEWEVGGVIDQTVDVVTVATELGDISVAITTLGDDFLPLADDRTTRYDKQVSLPISIVSKDWLKVLSCIHGPMSLIANKRLVFKVLEELFYIEHNPIEEVFTMQRADQITGSSQDACRVESEDESTLPVSLHLGELQLQLSQLAKLRKGHTLRLMEKDFVANEGFSCTLLVGSTHIGRGHIKFSGERVVLTISEML